MKFTEFLLDKYKTEYTKSVTHPFLQKAGDGSLSKEAFTSWLRQDYLYAHVGYTKAISLLLSRIPFPTSLSPSSPQEKNLLRAKEVLIGSLSNIEREVGLFTKTAEEHELQLFHNGSLPDTTTPSDASLLGPYESVTRSYVEFMISTAACGTIEEGLCLLWGMEKSYLDAWTFASEHLSESEPDGLTQKAIQKLIDNWTCHEFVEFVNDCEEIFDGTEVAAGTEVGDRCEDVFKRVIWLEQRFWPAV